tara:strand:- start:568 stop:759 length:192 start_codon:yes stop_codon:yes gene_type:complete
LRRRERLGRGLTAFFKALKCLLDHGFGDGNFPSLLINDGATVEILAGLLAVEVHGCIPLSLHD